MARVGREPLRKLSSTDWLVKPMMTAREYGLPCDKLLLGIGAALHYNNPEDPQSVKMQELIAAKGSASGRVGDHVDPRDRSRHRGDRRRYGRGRKTNPLSRLQSYEETFHRSDRADACDCNLVYLRRGGASRVGETASHRSDQ